MRGWDALEAELTRFRLPVSGRVVALRQPSGAEDLLLAEAARTSGGDAALALALAGRLGRAVEGEPIAWGSLSVCDLDVLVLRLRQALIGDRVRADVPCQAPECGRRIDIDFSVAEFLAHHAPAALEGPERGGMVASGDASGWFRVAPVPEDPGIEAVSADRGQEPWAPGESSAGDVESGWVQFRLPTADDLVAVAGEPAGALELARRCLRPAEVPPRLLDLIETAMEAMAPSLTSELEGLCPECGARVKVQFDARWFCLRELRDRAVFIYQDVDILARRYHWSQAEILAIPHVRRAAYAELARQAGGA